MKIRRFNENKQNRETVPVSEITKYDYLDGDYNDGWKWIETSEGNYDSEKGFVDFIVIMKRLSDNKFFKVEYTQYGHNGSSLQEETAVEVFPRQITKTIYE